MTYAPTSALVTKGSAHLSFGEAIDCGECEHWISKGMDWTSASRRCASRIKVDPATLIQLEPVPPAKWRILEYPGKVEATIARYAKKGITLRRTAR